jgi:enediyne biosynthesis thioesterase
MRSYEYRHIVSFEETNLVGNVYYVNHLKWQGRAREMFLREHAPECVRELGHGLALATVRCSCEYFVELEAFDEIVVRMRLTGLTHARISLAFDYYRRCGDGEELIARGEQEIACARKGPMGLVASVVPEALRVALAAFADHTEVCDGR